MEYPQEFDDIRPFFDSEVHDKMKDLIKEPGFEHAVRYVLRDINYEQLCQELLTIDKKKRLSTIHYESLPRRSHKKDDERCNRRKFRSPRQIKKLHILVQSPRHCARCFITQLITYSQRI